MPSFPNFSVSNNSLLRQHLTRDVFNQLKDRQTVNKVNLSDLIRSGLANQDSSIGIYAGDMESYDTFATLLDPVIESYHQCKLSGLHSENQKKNTVIKTDAFPDPDPSGNYVVSTRIRVARNLSPFLLGSVLTKKGYLKLEEKLKATLLNISGEFSGTYYSLTDLTDEQKNDWIKSHLLFKDQDRFLKAAGLMRHWPLGRGIFMNTAKTLILWLNEEDHLRIISMEKGGNLFSVANRLFSFISSLSEQLSFQYSDRLGYITSCPSNLGTAMRASVHIKLPHLAKNSALLLKTAERYHLQIRGKHGEHSTSDDAIYDISNKRRLGVTEVQCLTDLLSGTKEFIRLEKQQSLTKEPIC